jgi:hypothetical protein
MSTIDVFCLSSVDVFDVSNPEDEQELGVFQEHYTGLELVLKFAHYLDYKWNHIRAREERDVLKAEVLGYSKRQLDDFTNAADTYFLIASWYRHFNPDQFNEDRIDYWTSRYDGNHAYFLNKLVRKYVDPDWVFEQLWFDPNNVHVQREIDSTK